MVNKFNDHFERDFDSEGDEEPANAKVRASAMQICRDAIKEDKEAEREANVKIGFIRHDQMTTEEMRQLVAIN